MKHLSAIVAALSIALTPAMAKAAEKTEVSLPISANLAASTTFVDRYITGSGFIPYDGPSVQPSLTTTVNHANFGSVFANYWGNCSVDGTGNEQDITTAYTTPPLDLGIAGAATASLGYFGGRSYGAGLGEGNLTLALANIVNPAITIARDFNDGSGTYGGVSISPSLQLDEVASLSLTEALRFNDRYFVNSSGISGLRTDLALNLRAGNTTLSMGGRHHLALNPGFKDGFAFTTTLAYSHDLF